MYTSLPYMRENADSWLWTIWKEIVNTICHVYYFVLLNFSHHGEFAYTIFKELGWSFYVSVGLRPIWWWKWIFDSWVATTENSEFSYSLSLSDRIFQTPLNLHNTSFSYAFTTMSVDFSGMVWIWCRFVTC